MPSQFRGTPYSATATGTGASSTATKTGVANKTIYVTDISGSSDKAAAKILVKDGSTVIWQDQIQITASGTSYYEHTFSTPLPVTTGATLTVVVDGTTFETANVAGFVLNNT